MGKGTATRRLTEEKKYKNGKEKEKSLPLYRFIPKSSVPQRQTDSDYRGNSLGNKEQQVCKKYNINYTKLNSELEYNALARAMYIILPCISFKNTKSISKSCMNVNVTQSSTPVQ
jgi:hypothetical protein